MHEPYPFFDGSHQAGGKELQSLPKSRQLALQFKAEDHPDAEMYTGGYGFEDLLGGNLACRWIVESGNRCILLRAAAGRGMKF